MSRFNASTWKAFVEARRPQQVVADLHKATDGPVYHCDVRSCRYNALVECNNRLIPIFSPIDEIQPVTDYQLSDFMWCEVPPSRTRSPLQSFAYDGPRWYSRAECQFLLEHGICRWEDFRLALQATTHRPPKDLASKLRFMRETWEEAGGTFAGEEWAGERRGRAKDLLAKTAMLALIGLWGRTENHRYTTMVTNHPDDCAFDGDVLTSPAPGSSVFRDITYRQRVLSHACYLPLNLIGRSLERLNVARSILVCLKYMRIERLLSIQVDCLVFQPPKKRARRVYEELQGMSFENLHLATRRPLSRFAGPLQTNITSTEKVYHLHKLDEPLYPGGALALQQGERPQVEQLEWNVQKEPATGDDTFAECVVQHVLSGKSCCVIGPPGSGKSQGVLGPLRDRLEEAGERVEVLAPTNCAARIVKGQTCHAFLTKMASSRYGFSGIILID
jgi:hypothetical protein